jgi:hypothetical protein
MREQIGPRGQRPGAWALRSDAAPAAVPRFGGSLATVDTTSGNVYVADGDNRIDEFSATGMFDPSGSFILTFGWRVGADSQLQFEVCRTGCQTKRPP